MRNYLETNRALVQELRTTLWTPPAERINIGTGSSSIVESFGSFYSPSHNRILYFALKRPTIQDSPEMVEDRLIQELSIFNTISIHKPHLSIPSPHILLKINNQAFGILTEDLSRNGERKIESSSSFPDDLYRLFGRYVEESEIAFSVEGQDIFADFYPFFQLSNWTRALNTSPLRESIEQVRQEIDEHTLSLSSDKLSYNPRQPLANLTHQPVHT